MDPFPSADNCSVALINQISGHNGTDIRNFSTGHRLISSVRTEDGEEEEDDWPIYQPKQQQQQDQKGVERDERAT